MPALPPSQIDEFSDPPASRPADGHASRGRVALDKFPGIVFELFRSVDGHWTFPFAGRELAGIFMTSADELAGSVGPVTKHVPEEDLARLKQTLKDSLESGQTAKVRFRVRLPDSPERWLEMTAAPELVFSGGTLWHGFVADVSSDQNANRRLRQLHRRWTLAARAAGIGVLEYDIDASSLSFDAIACEHHGIEAEQARLGLSNWLDLVVPEDRLVAHAALNSMPLEGFAECLMLRVASAMPAATPAPNPSGAPAPPPAPGEIRTLELMFQGVSDERRLVGTCRDVTQRQSLEALRSEKMAAEKANRSKTEFMSRVSHELRTPLNGILGFVQLMALDRQHPLPPAHKRRLEVLQQSGSRLLGLIDQLLDVSRIEDGRISLRPKAIDPAPTIDQCVAAVFPLAQSKGVAVSTDVSPGAAPINVDPQALEQVLSNLLSNAIKYNRPNGRVRVRYDSGEFGRLIVDDTGIGMSETQLSMLFEPFNRLGAERTPVLGSGLGLVITRKLVHAMGGTIDVQSMVGRGSRFDVRLPLAEHVRLDAGAALSPSAFPSEWGSDIPVVVIYVEDDEVNALLMEHVFMSQPAWHLVVVTTGADGLRAAIERQPAVMLIDLHLPDMSGLELLERLRADGRTSHLPCVAVSADALPDQVDQALASGFDRYWTKPLDLPSVVAELKAILRADPALVTR